MFLSINFPKVSLNFDIFQAYDLMKYEHILQLPARKVTEYLSKESEAPAKVVKDESEEILERIEYERRNSAAKVIQRAVSWVDVWRLPAVNLNFKILVQKVS